MKRNLLAIIICIIGTVLAIAGVMTETSAPAVSYKAFSPGDIVPDTYLKEHGDAQFFANLAIPDTIFSLMQGKTYKKGCSVARKSLRYILCLHRDIKGRTIVGEMVVNASIADDVLSIFRELYRANYPIERMRLIDYWDADDEQSMRSNNSSSFNYRLISHTNVVSKHGLGLAIDINPLYNPYHKHTAQGVEVIEPATGKPYLDRSKSFDYKIEKGDLCYRLFIKHGFKWGGSWPKVKDYQHFEK